MTGCGWRRIIARGMGVGWARWGRVAGEWGADGFFRASNAERVVQGVSGEGAELGAKRCWGGLTASDGGAWGKRGR